MTAARFVVQMAIRETKSAWRRLIFFFVCIAVGVAAIVALRSVIRNVRDVFGQEARSLIAADVLVSTTRDWTPEARLLVERRLADVNASSTETIETATMARPAGEANAAVRMVELLAVESGFPLYGTLELADGRAFTHAILEGRGVLVRPELLATLSLEIGDALVIGQSTFTIRGVIVSEPGRRIEAFSQGPRVIVDATDLADTGLLAFGSRARRVYQVKVAEADIEPLVATLRDDFKDAFVNVRSYRSRDDELGRNFDRAENYLSLIGFVVVILGGIAVSSVTRVFIVQKVRGIAVLKCVGATSRQIIAIYVLQILALGAAGSLVGVVLAWAAVRAIPYAMGPLGQPVSLLEGIEYGVTWRPAVQGLGIGMLVSLLFSIVPLLHVRRIRPSRLLRDESTAAGWDWTAIGAATAVALGLVALTAWQAESWRVGAVVCAGFAGLALALHVAGQGLVRLVTPLAASPSFPLRHAVLHLSRPGNQTRVILLAVGLGAFFIVGVRSLQSSLLEEFSFERTAGGADMFLMDVQPDQADALEMLLADPVTGTGPAQLVPVVRARVVGVDGRETSLESFEDVRARGSLAREYTVTYRDHLEANEDVVAGTFWDGPSDMAEVSVEEGLHERFAIDVGDVMRFDVLGRTIEARVTSIRRVDWTDARSGGFMFVFLPGVLEDAPQTIIVPLKGPVGAEARGRFQHDLVTRFPNVSVIDFEEILVNIRDVMERVTLAITVVGGLVLFSGGLILVGAVAMTKFQRVYEAAVFRTLGASTRTIARMLLIEYGLLGALAGLVGSLGAVALTWGVSRWALDMPWRLVPAEHLAGVLATTVLVASIGLASSLDVLRHKPLLTLRGE